MKPLSWIWFFIVQLIMLVATVLGWFVLIPFCLAQAWTIWEHTPVGSIELKSIKDGRRIDTWSAPLLKWIYGNPEDGVSGQQTLINGNQPYMPNAWAPWRAYCWSALRNSCDELKYIFAWKNGPIHEWTWTLLGKVRNAKMGWQKENGYNVPVLSL